jgi:3-oxoacyl-[acyl-carrier-protein] synthase III
MIGVQVAGWGSALPENRVTNDDLANRLDTSDDWITERTGIRERRIAGKGESTGPLAEAAAREALERAGVAASDLDLVVVATSTPEMPLPATAAWVTARLGATAGALDLNAACAGFVYALTTTTALLRQGDARTALVVGADTLSSIIDPDDRTTAVLFGDGAAALVLTAGPDAPDPAGCGLVTTDLVTDPAGVELLVVPGGGSARPASAETLAGREHYLRMDGREVFRRAVRAVTGSIERTLDRAACTPDDIALFVPHQANARIIDAVLSRTGIPPARTSSTVDRYGNTSAASIPLGLTEAAESGGLSDGDLVLMTGFGAGLTIGTALWRWRATIQRKDAA